MGRHGGGSRSGGCSRSGGRSSGGSRRSGSGTRTSTTPFYGCYNRSYINRRGVYVDCYTDDGTFGTKSGWSAGTIFALIFITCHMFFMLSGFLSSFVTFGGKVDGNTDRIIIVDNADILTDKEEQKTIKLLHEVYDESGMPVTIYTDDFSWRDYYDSIEVYSEELYYSMGLDEDAMIILFTANKNANFYNWQYDMYCGDDTIKCFSDATFDKLLDNFQKGMSGQNLYEALDYSWNSVMNDLAKTSVNWDVAPIILLILAFYSIFYITIFIGTRKQNEAYKYFKENPDKLTTNPITLYSKCPSCAASNSTQSEVCLYCGTLLKISDSNINFINPY